MSNVPQDEKQIFLQALERSPGDEREQFLHDACAHVPDMLRRVRTLLESHDRTSGPLDLPPVNGNTAAYEPVTEGPGDTIGPYKLLQQIGEGGMGVVYMADQTEPITRRVALKIIKPGMDTRQVIARFEAERQALAMMDHPHIAKVIDAGTTDTGRPYFVMELVKGVPITEYCDRNRLTPRQRLELFLPVCHAIQHAHQKGIIHRDVKPSNVLVAKYDDQPVPKIIDFGVAKAIQHRLTEKTMFTEFGQVLGTVDYMSPEQAQLNQWDVDTRSDVYSLGVLLYELLAGETPFDRHRLRTAAFDELLRIIREEDPPRPSTRAGSSQSLPTIAAARHTEPAKLTALVRGELDWIVMKALDKDRTRRYDSASKFAEDVQHYLDDEPVEACPPSSAYRLAKFARRHQPALATLALVTAALLIGTAVASWQAIRATYQRDRAIAAEEMAAQEAARSEQVAQFLKDMLAAAGPRVARGRDATLLREVLDSTAARVERDLTDQPEIQGDMWLTLGTTYQDIDDHSQALKSFERAADCFRIAPGAPNAKLATVLSRLGYSHSFLKDLPTGRRLADSGLEMARRVGDEESLATCLYYRALASNEFGMSSKEAIPYLEEARDIYRAFGDRPIAEAECIRHLAACVTDDDDLPKDERLAKAISLARQAHEILRKHLESDDPRALIAQWLVGQILLFQENAVEAEPILRDTLETWEAVYDDDHPHNYVVRNRLAAALALQNKWDEAHKIIEGVPQETYPRESQYRDFYRSMFEHLANQGRWKDLRTVSDDLQQRLTEAQSKYGPDHRSATEYEKLLAEIRAKLSEVEQPPPAPR